MKLKNNALQELYDTIFGGSITFTVVEESPIDKVFRECDEKLSDSVTFATIKDLQDRNDILEGSNKALLEANMKSISKTRKLEKEIDYLKKDKKQLEEALQDTQTTLVKANDDRANLLEAVDKLSGENRSLNARTNCLRKEVEWYRKHYKEQSDKIQDLKSRLNSMCGDKYIKKLHDFCANRFCKGCPLASNEYKCGRGYSFTGAKPIPDEDIERYYEKARKTWTCTLEGTVEIDKDLLNKVFGIDSDD